MDDGNVLPVKCFPLGSLGHNLSPLLMLALRFLKKKLVLAPDVTIRINAVHGPFLGNMSDSVGRLSSSFS